MRSGFQRSIIVGLLYAVLGTASVHARPIPTGMGTTTVSYMTHHGAESFSGQRDYSGTGPGSATPLGTAPNIAAFNSVNSFGRRSVVDIGFPDVIRDNESLVTNAFFKINNNGDYFPNLEHHGDVTIKVENMTFTEPVTVLENTFMFHTFWLSSQVDMLLPPSETYLNIHNHHTAAVNFRDLHEFEASGVFAHGGGGGHGHGGENAGFGDVHPLITGDGTAGNPLSIELTVPYHLFANLEQVDQEVPPGLPGPQGFLEPFHFHLEYVVVPEPATIGLLAISSLFVIVRRRRVR